MVHQAGRQKQCLPAHLTGTQCCSASSPHCILNPCNFLPQPNAFTLSWHGAVWHPFGSWLQHLEEAWSSTQTQAQSTLMNSKARFMDPPPPAPILQR